MRKVKVSLKRMKCTQTHWLVCGSQQAVHLYLDAIEYIVENR